MIPAVPGGIAIEIMGEHGWLSEAVGVPLSFAMLFAGLVGWGMAMIGMLTLSYGDSAMFNNYRTRVFSALFKGHCRAAGTTHL